MALQAGAGSDLGPVVPAWVVAMISALSHDTFHAGVPVAHPRPRAAQLGGCGDQGQAIATVEDELFESGAALPVGQRVKVLVLA
jgi:hypothetical protein